MFSLLFRWLWLIVLCLVFVSGAPPALAQQPSQPTTPPSSRTNPPVGTVLPPVQAPRLVPRPSTKSLSWWNALPRSAPQPFGFNAGGGIGIDVIDGDWFMLVNAGFEMRVGRLRLGLQLPLRFSLYDAAPTQQPPRELLSIRREDWDHWTDFARVIRYISYGVRGDPLFLRLGPLVNARLGHGTLVHQYSNAVNVDRYHLGFEGELHTPYGGVEAMLNSLLFPRVAGVRGYVRPVAFISPQSFWTRLAVGLTTVMDFYAPYRLQLQSGVQSVVNDDDFVSEFRTLGALGFDVELTLVNRSWVKIVPYLDVNMLLGYGAGLHIGVLGEFTGRAGSLATLQVRSRLEYRMLGSGYLPQYFNAFYEVNRYSGAFTPLQTTQRLVLPQLAGLEQHRQDLIHGWYGELFVAMQPWFSVGLSYDDYQGPNNSNLAISLQIPVLRYFQFGASYTKRGFEGAGELFSFDERSLLAASLRVPLTSYLAAQVQYRRLWRPEVDGQGLLRYEGINDFSVSLNAFYQNF